MRSDHPWSASLQYHFWMRCTRHRPRIILVIQTLTELSYIKLMMLTLTYLCSHALHEAQPMDLRFVPAQLSSPVSTCRVPREEALSQMVEDIEKSCTENRDKSKVRNLGT